MPIGCPMGWPIGIQLDCPIGIPDGMLIPMLGTSVKQSAWRWVATAPHLLSSWPCHACCPACSCSCPFPCIHLVTCIRFACTHLKRGSRRQGAQSAQVHDNSTVWELSDNSFTIFICCPYPVNHPMSLLCRQGTISLHGHGGSIAPTISAVAWDVKSWKEQESEWLAAMSTVAQCNAIEGFSQSVLPQFLPCSHHSVESFTHVHSREFLWEPWGPNGPSLENCVTSGQECNSDVGNCLDCPCLVPCPSIPCSVIQYPLACSFLMFLAVAVKDKVGGGRTRSKKELDT